jgi:hypothetical protein
MRNAKLSVFALAALVAAGQVNGTEIGGMLSMTPILEDSYAAIWLPVPPGQAISGLRWYNNDETTVFPRVLVASGTADTPVYLEGAVEVASAIQGVSLGWSQVTFSQPYACQGEGLYCLIVFPEGAEYVAAGTGGGAAIGYASEGGHEGWLCADEETWTKIEGVSGLAIEPMLIAATPGMVLMNLQAPVSLVRQAPQLQGAHPNPFNPLTVLEYSLPEAQPVDLAIYDVSGRLVRRLATGVQTAGTHSVTWQGDDEQGRRQSSGLYFARFVAGTVHQTERLVLVK